MNGAVNMGSGHGMAKAAGKHSPQKKAAAGKHSGQMNWPAQALKQTRPADGTGLAAKQQLPMKLAGLCLAATQPADEAGQPLPFSGGWWRECGGAGHLEGGLGPTYLSPSQPIAFACHCTYPLP